MLALLQLPCPSPVCEPDEGKSVLETAKPLHRGAWDRPGQHSSTVLAEGDPSVPHRIDLIQLSAFWRTFLVMSWALCSARCQ